MRRGRRSPALADPLRRRRRRCLRAGFDGATARGGLGSDSGLEVGRHPRSPREPHDGGGRRTQHRGARSPPAPRGDGAVQRRVREDLRHRRRRERALVGPGPRASPLDRPGRGRDRHRDRDRIPRQGQRPRSGVGRRPRGDHERTCDQQPAGDARRPRADGGARQLHPAG